MRRLWAGSLLIACLLVLGGCNRGPGPVSRVLLQRTIQTDQTVEGFLLEAEVYMNLAESPSDVVEQILLASKDIQVVAEERKIQKTQKATTDTPTPWQHGPAGFDFVVRMEAEAHQPVVKIGEPIKVQIKEAWSAEKVSAPQLKRSWVVSYELSGAEFFSPRKDEGERKIVPARGPVLKELREFIRANRGGR